MKLIFLFGMPATGKLTVAEELSKLTGIRLFHNHLAVDLLLSVFPFGSEAFVQLREEIWLSVFDHACRSGMPHLIFTFNPETSVRPTFVDAVHEMLARHGGEIDFIELVCPLPELRQRMDSPSRLQYRKLSSLDLFEKLHSEGIFDTSHMPKPRLTLDTSQMTPQQAALAISKTLDLPPGAAVG